MGKPNKNQYEPCWIPEELEELGLNTYASGVKRSSEFGKPDYTLLSWELIDAWAVHMTAHGLGQNWRQASTIEDLDRAVRSAYRHFRSVVRDETDEDHTSALVYNLGVIRQIRALG